MNKYLFILIISLLSFKTILAAPAMESVIINQKTMQCATFWPGDECFRCSIPDGWIYSNQDSFQSCPEGYKKISLKYECSGLKIPSCCRDNHSGLQGDCEDMIINDELKQCRFVNNIDSCSVLSDGWKPAKENHLGDFSCPFIYNWIEEPLLCTIYEASWISQTQPQNTGTTNQFFRVQPGDVVKVEAKFKNTGTATWKNTGAEEVTMAIYKDTKVQSGPFGSCFSDPRVDCTGMGKFGESYFYHPSWHTAGRTATLIEDEVKSGEIGTFKLTFQVPKNAPPGSYREDITLAFGPNWMDNFTNGDEINKAHVWVGIAIDDELS